MWTPFTIAKLVSPRTMVYDTDNTYNLYITDRTYNYSSGGKKQLLTGGSHIVYLA